MLINCHAHVFNLRSVLTDHALDILRNRIRREVTPAPVAEAVAGVLTSLFESVQGGGGGLDEGRIVQELLDRLTEAAGFDQLREGLPRAARSLLGRGLDRLENRLLFRLLEDLDRLLDHRSGDARSATVTDVLALLRLALQTTTREVAARMMHQLGPERGTVALMMDITNGDGSDDELFDRQVRDLSDLVLAYPGRLFPFFAIHTARGDHLTLMTEALTSKGFVGVKLYPALGYRVDTDEMKDVLREAARLDAPLLSHTTPSGFFQSEDTLDFGDPVHWGPLLEEVGDFRICFAHFGGSSNLTRETIPGLEADDPRRRWTARILELMRGDPDLRVFADVSFHTAPMEGSEEEELYFRSLEAFLDEPALRDRILFGTDSWLVRLRLSEGSYWRFFQDGVSTNGLSRNGFRRLAETNNHRFLGLPLASPKLPLRGNIERYVEFVHEHRGDLRSRPAPWLLEALGRLHGPGVVEELERREWPVADELDIPDWKELVDTVLQDVLDTTVSGDLGARLDIVDASFDFGAAPLEFQGDGELSVQVFNRVDQFRSSEGADPDGILGPPSDTGGAGNAEDPFAPFHGPALSFDPQKAWVKYRTEGRLALGLSSDFGLRAVGLEAAAGKTVTLTDYRQHERSARLRDVVPRDLGWPRFALDCEDVLRMERGDAVSFQARGELTARVTVSWSDILTFGLGRLARALDSSTPLAVEVSPGLSVSAGVSYEDDFRVVFARTSERGRRPWRVEVRTAESRGRGLTTQISAGVRFENPSLVSSLLTRRLQAPLHRVEALLRKDDLDDLGPIQRRLFDEVAERLGVSSLVELGERLAELRETAESTLDEIVRTRLELGFRYEYSRIETDTAMIVAEMDARAVEALHPQLVRGSYATVLEWEEAARQPGNEPLADSLRILQCVLAHETTVRKSWGFALQFGRWLRIAESNRQELVQRRQRARLESGEATQRLTYLGSRSYTGVWLDRLWGWDVDLDARMERTSSHDEALISDFTFGLGLRLHWRDDKLSEHLLDQVLDTAALWGVLPEESGGIDALRSRFETALQGEGSLGRGDLLGREVGFELQLLFDQVALARILPRARRDDPEGRRRIADAMAAAMPLHSTFALHRNLTERRRVYSSLFSQYLEDARSGSFVLERRLSQYWRDAQAHLDLLGHPQEARQEAGTRALDRMWTFAGMLAKNRRTAQDWNSCLEGLQVLAEGVGRVTERKHSMIKGMFKDLARFWGQAHHLRALAAYLLDAARVQGSPAGVVCSLRIELEREGEGLDVLVGPPRP